MINKKVDLYDYFGISKPEGARAILEVIAYDKMDYCPNRKRPAMLVIPGGGYGSVSDREKDCIAFYYLNKGYNTFTLKYSVKPVRFPAQLIEGCMALAYIKENVEELGIIEDKISAVGFSAGGHLCGMLATMTDAKEVKDALKDKANNIAPNAVILSYPVISAFTNPHKGSIGNLSGGDSSVVERVSIERNVTLNTPPAFIWTTVNDHIVPSDNSLEVAKAYKTAGVPFELHMFENGRHGLSIGTKETIDENESIRPWLEMSALWLKNRGFDITD